jgi:hypothetical protein
MSETDLYVEEVINPIEEKRRTILTSRLHEEFESDVLFTMLRDRKKHEIAIQKVIPWLDTEKFYSTAELARHLEIRSDSNIRAIIRPLRQYIKPDDSANSYRLDYKGAFKVCMVILLKEEMKIPMIAKYVSDHYGFESNESEEMSNRAEQVEETAERVEQLEETLSRLVSMLSAFAEVDGSGKIKLKNDFFIENIQQSLLPTNIQPAGYKELQESVKQLESRSEDYDHLKDKVHEQQQTIIQLQKRNEDLAVEMRDREFILNQIQRRVESKLRRQAVQLWEQQPENVRFSTSLFGLRKVEKNAERDQFIQTYLDKHFSEELTREMNILSETQKQLP